VEVVEFVGRIDAEVPHRGDVWHFDVVRNECAVVRQNVRLEVVADQKNVIDLRTDRLDAVVQAFTPVRWDDSKTVHVVSLHELEEDRVLETQPRRIADFSKIAGAPAPFIFHGGPFTFQRYYLRRFDRLTFTLETFTRVGTDQAPRLLLVHTTGFEPALFFI
jgi:hypothetical protein